MMDEPIPYDEISKIEVGGEAADRISRAWFIPGQGMDWMATSLLSAVDGKWKCVYRFRYHADNTRWGKHDRKSWYTVVADDGDIAKLNDAVDKLAELLVMTGFGGPIERIEPKDGSAADFMRQLTEKDWSTYKTLPGPPPSN